MRRVAPIVPTSTPFLTDCRSFAERDLHLLPTASVVLAFQRTEAGVESLFVLPHRTVWVLRNVVECAALAPNFVKCLLGEPRRFLASKIAASTHPMLSPFADCQRVDDAAELLVDLRGSLTITTDERDFVDLWMEHRTSGTPIPTGDRRAQRLCLRFAGQSPKAINMTSQLARTLDADNERGLYNGLGAFADASHLARVCRSYTGKTPTSWRNMSQTFY